MKSAIRVIKRKQTQETTQTTPEIQKPAEPNPNKTRSTVKSWITEFQERKRRQKLSLPILAVLILLASVIALSRPVTRQTQDISNQAIAQTANRPLTPEERAIKVTIATVASFFGPPTTRYKVGDQIPVTITMTNTSKSILSTCVSSDLYQDLPKLTRDGKEVPYMNWQSYERVNAQRNHVCENENLPEPMLLKPNEPKLADWFVLVDTPNSSGAEAWYDPLPPGKYELSIQRRLACCEGPMVESNKTSFEVIPATD